MYITGDIIKTKVLKIMKTHIMVKPLGSSKYFGILHISEISDYLVKDLKKYCKLGQVFHLYILSVDDSKQFINFSHKKIRPRLLKNPFSFDIEETKKGFENLYLNTMKVVQND